MARTIKEISESIKASYVSERAAAGLSFDDPALWSVVNLKRLFVAVFAIATNTLEKIWDVYKADVTQQLLDDKPHTLRWYRKKALEFQLGSDLVTDEDYYDNSLLTADQVAEQRIIVQAAAVVESNIMKVKVVKLVGDDFAPLDDLIEVPAFTEYMFEVKDAGVAIDVISSDPDKIKMALTVQYDPLVLDYTGARLDGTSSTPIQDALRDYLKNLEFNGRYLRSKHQDAVQAVEGVRDVSIVSVQATRFTVPTFTSINMQYNPFAGFMRFYDNADITLTLVPYQE